MSYKATFGHCLGCLLPKLAFDNAVGSRAHGKHSPWKACLSPGDGHKDWLQAEESVQGIAGGSA